MAEKRRGSGLLQFGFTKKGKKTEELEGNESDSNKKDDDEIELVEVDEHDNDPEKDENTEKDDHNMTKDQDTVTVTASTSKEKNLRKERAPVLKWLKEFSWLVYRDEKMFCKLCEANPPASSANVSGFASSSTSSMYKRESVTIHHGKNISDFASTGCTPYKRESVIIHGKSKRHIFVRDNIIGSKLSGATVAANFQRQLLNQDEKTMNDMALKLRTAYFIGKQELPFTKFRSLIELQNLNGIDLNKTYANDMKCTEMIACINEELKSELESKLHDSKYFSILIDAGTECSAKENEAINIRFVSNGNVETKLLGVIELEHAHADGTMKAIHQSLEQAGFPNYQNHLIGFCADGASVNFGKSGGVQKKLTDLVPWLIPIWCMPHRLELAIMHMIKSVPKAADVMDIMHLIYKTYHYSPKSKRELRKIGLELGVNVCNPTRVKGTRWSPHIEKALRVLLKPPKAGELSQYAVIYQHMEHLASTSTNADIKGPRTSHKK